LRTSFAPASSVSCLLEEKVSAANIAMLQFCLTVANLKALRFAKQPCYCRSDALAQMGATRFITAIQQRANTDNSSELQKCNSSASSE
jgi:hypothetical protein